jgi:NAD(P)H dehydrogenase (quinone)
MNQINPDPPSRPSPSPRVLIAAGGGRVAAALCAAGEPPRALARDPEKARGLLAGGEGASLPMEVVGADLTDSVAVRRALKGIDVAFLALGSSPAQVDPE